MNDSQLIHANNLSLKIDNMKNYIRNVENGKISIYNENIGGQLFLGTIREDSIIFADFLPDVKDVKDKFLCNLREELMIMERKFALI